MLKPIAASMDDDQKSELGHDINAIAWFDIKDGNAVQTVLLEASQTKQTATRKRTCMQDLMAFTSYFTEAEWDEPLLNVNVAMTSRSNVSVKSLPSLVVGVLTSTRR